MLDPTQITVDKFGCWRFTGRLNSRGYAPHKRIYESQRGALPPGVQLDHLCRRRTCVNPRHLEPVSRSANLERRNAWHRRFIAACPEGHRLTPETTLRTPEGGVVCTICPLDGPDGQ